MVNRMIRKHQFHRFSRANVTRSSCCLLNRPSSKRGWRIQRDAMTLLNSLSSRTMYPIIKHYYKSTTESGSGRLHADPLQTTDFPPFTWTMQQHPLRFACAAVEQAESLCLCSSRQMTPGSLHMQYSCFSGSAALGSGVVKTPVCHVVFSSAAAVYPPTEYLLTAEQRRRDTSRQCLTTAWIGRCFLPRFIYKIAVQKLIPFLSSRLKWMQFSSSSLYFCLPC